MPFYRCTAPAGWVRPEQRPRIAREFTRIHSSITGAPETFVHVHFSDTDCDDRRGGEPCQIHGTVRAGRSAGVTSQLIDQLTRAFAEIAEVAADGIAMSLTEVPASWIMEGGEISPEPGAEAEWLKRHSDAPES